MSKSNIIGYFFFKKKIILKSISNFLIKKIKIKKIKKNLISIFNIKIFNIQFYNKKKIH